MGLGVKFFLLDLDEPSREIVLFVLAAEAESRLLVASSRSDSCDLVGEVSPRFWSLERCGVTILWYSSTPALHQTTCRAC